MSDQDDPTLDDEPLPPAPPGATLIVHSREEGRNSIVTLWPDRIERVKQKKRTSLSRAKQDAEVIPMRSVSSVQAKKDGLRFTKVIVFASGNTIEFRLAHTDAQRFKDAITNAILAPSQPAAPTPAPAPPSSGIDDLERLADLRDRGIITPEDFDAKKRQILGLS